MPGILRVLRRQMISGQNSLLYSYALWLIGRLDYQVPLVL